MNSAKKLVVLDNRPSTIPLQQVPESDRENFSEYTEDEQKIMQMNDFKKKHDLAVEQFD